MTVFFTVQVLVSALNEYENMVNVINMVLYSFEEDVAATVKSILFLFV